MRGLIVSVVLFVLCIIGAFAGLFSAQTGIAFLSCGALYLVMFTLAWTTRGYFAGKRIQLVDTRQPRYSAAPPATRAKAPAVNGRARPEVVADETL